MPVYPTRSTKSTVTTLRSVAMAARESWRRRPQDEQKRLSDGLSSPHRGHADMAVQGMACPGSTRKTRACACRPPEGRILLGNAGEEEGARLAHHLASDHEALDLLRALVDLRDLRVPHEALDRVLLDVAVAPEDLDGVGRHRHGDVTALELRHRGRLRQLGAVDSRVGHLPEPVEQAARSLAPRP